MAAALVECALKTSQGLVGSEVWEEGKGEKEKVSREGEGESKVALKNEWEESGEGKGGWGKV